MSPAEAVEAAAKAAYEFQYSSLEGMWEFANPRVQGDFRNELRAALEAAAAGLLAEAFDQGQKSGTRHADRLVAAAKIGRPELPGPISPNPYRPTP
jgi:hypothetical protein